MVSQYGQLLPVLVVVCPLRSGSVVQLDVPTRCASTVKKSQSGSLLRTTWKVSRPPVAGTVKRRVSRL